MKIDNFKLINDFIGTRKRDDGTFYFAQVIQRKKDFAENVKSVRVLKSYYIYDAEYLMRKTDEIINLCEENRARAYINLNERSARAVAFKMLKETADALYNGAFASVAKLYDSCCGQTCSASEKLWLIDLDGNKTALESDIMDYIDSRMPVNESTKLALKVPTRHGVHLLVSPFDKREFGMKFPNIDMHKDNPTMLYYPESIDNV